MPFSKRYKTENPMMVFVEEDQDNISQTFMEKKNHLEVTYRWSNLRVAVAAAD